MIICPFCPTADILGLGELNAAPLYMEEDLEIPNTPDYIRLPFPIFSPDSMPFSSHVTPHVTARPPCCLSAMGPLGGSWHGGSGWHHWERWIFALGPHCQPAGWKGGPSTATVCWADLAKSSRYLGMMLQDGLNENCSDLLQTSQFLMVKSCFSSSCWSQHPPSFGVCHKS